MKAGNTSLSIMRYDVAIPKHLKNMANSISFFVFGILSAAISETLEFLLFSFLLI